MRRTISAMVAGRRRWIERMQRAKVLGLIDKIPTGRRRPKIGAAPSKAVARARGIAFRVIEPESQAAPSKRREDMSFRELLAEAFLAALRFQLAILDHPAGDNLELRRLQMKIARDLLSLRIG
jgi:hypothetical protein